MSNTEMLLEQNFQALKEILDELKGLREDFNRNTAADIVCQDPSWSDLTFPISIDGFQTKHNY